MDYGISCSLLSQVSETIPYGNRNFVRVDPIILVLEIVFFEIRYDHPVGIQNFGNMRNNIDDNIAYK